MCCYNWEHMHTTNRYNGICTLNYLYNSNLDQLCAVNTCDESHVQRSNPFGKVYIPTSEVDIYHSTLIMENG